MLVEEMLSSSKCNGAPDIGARFFKIFNLPEEGDESKTECCLPKNKALLLLCLEH